MRIANLVNAQKAKIKMLALNVHLTILFLFLFQLMKIHRMKLVFVLKKILITISLKAINNPHSF